MSDHKPTFTRAALETLDECRAIVDQRGTEYLDSWSLANLSSPFLDNMLKTFGVELSKEQKRLVIMAALCDVKLSRLVGPFKKDTVVDLVNYSSALSSLFEEYSSMREYNINVAAMITELDAEAREANAIHTTGRSCSGCVYTKEEVDVLKGLEPVRKRSDKAYACGGPGPDACKQAYCPDCY